MSRWMLCVLVVLAAACASPQRLSASIYAHEEQARALDASGEHTAAAAQRDQAEQERERLSSKQAVVAMRAW